MEQDFASVRELSARRLPFADLLVGWRAPALAAGVLVVVLLPFFAKNFFIFQLTLALIYALAILGLNLLTGFNGQFSLGHSAFYAIGAYTAAILMDQADIPYYATLPVAGMLIAPVVFLEPNMMTSVLLYGFAAAVVGGLTSPGGAVIGGFAVGIIENLAGTFIPYVGRELKLTIALFLIVAVLLVKPSGLFGRRVVSRV